MLAGNLRSRLRSQLLLLCLSTVFLAVFLVVALFRGSFTGVNAQMNAWSTSVNTGVFTSAALVIATVFDTESLIVISLAVAAALLVLRFRKDSLMLLCAMASDAILVMVIKALIRSPRPTDMIVPDNGFSFPSGHVTGSVVLFGVLTYLAWKHWNSMKARATMSSLYVAITAVVGFDRIYLNVHWFSDVVGGVFLGGFMLLFTLSIFESARSNWFKTFSFPSRLKLKPVRSQPSIILIRRLKNKFLHILS